MLVSGFLAFKLKQVQIAPGRVQQVGRGKTKEGGRDKEKNTEEAETRCLRQQMMKTIVKGQRNAEKDGIAHLSHRFVGCTPRVEYVLLVPGELQRHMNTWVQLLFSS
ncbi:hypothetical protein QQF64_008850 [Cirrhinus molitorella]|uniref:Uncharacterized protein n=1 Tax=Cirrhinus molitorella TaxID=172907 RepID=A0ABR3M7B2_9TELE